jgi:arylsulfatase A-like enzyme
VYHPEFGGGERRDHLVQLVDIFPTVLDAVGRDPPADIHGRNLTHALEDPDATLREYAISGLWGASVSITDGDWVLHQSPVAENEPLYWYGITGETRAELGDYDPEAGRREATGWDPAPCSVPTWLSDKRSDPNELDNLAAERPAQLATMQTALADTLRAVDAPAEQLDRLGIAGA